MTFDVIVKRLIESRDPAAVELVAAFRIGEVHPVSPGPGRGTASTLSATYAIRAKTSSAAGIKGVGLETTVARLAALAPDDPILSFHFSGAKRVFSVFVREVDEQVVGIVMVDRTRTASWSDLPLPDALRVDLASNRPLSADQKARLAVLLKAVGKPMPELYDASSLYGANQLWTSEHVGAYLGQVSATHRPGNIDPSLAVIIGQAEPDGPIALDYRVSPPRVVYLGDVDHHSYWIELCPSYDALAALLSQHE